MQIRGKGQPRSEVVAFRCTRLESELITALAAEADTSVSAFLRSVALAKVGPLVSGSERSRSNAETALP